MDTTQDTLLGFPRQEPKIEVVRLDETPAEIECRELLWLGLQPEVGMRQRWAEYEEPAGALSQVGDVEALGVGKVHDREGVEMRYRVTRQDGTTKPDAYVYGVIEEGMAHWLGWWNMAPELKFFTYKDEGFLDADWPPNPIRVADTGRIRWLSDTKVETSGSAREDPLVDAIGAGMCRLRMGDREFRCVHTLDVPEPVQDWSLVNEGFLSTNGRMLAVRAYTIGTRKWDDWVASQHLASAPKLICNGITYYHWYDIIMAEALGIE